MQTLKINLFGESWTLKKLECSPEDMDKCLIVAAKMKISIQEALLNPFFYYNLELPQIRSLENLPNKKISGLLNAPRNQIEVLLDGKRINKIHFADLVNLFPIYKTASVIIANSYSPGIYVEQKAIGFIGSYELIIDDFIPEDLQFNLIEFKGKQILLKPVYQNKNFKFKKKDTSINYQNSFTIME